VTEGIIMPRIFSEAEVVESLAEGLIPNYHPHLANARMMYVFIDKASKKGGKELYGKAQKVSGVWEWAVDRDFLITIPADKWGELQEAQKTALVDSLLERCGGEEDEKSGEMKWVIREPDVQEFSCILERHGAWHADLERFVVVAKEVDISHIIEEAAEVDLSGEVETVGQGETT